MVKIFPLDLACKTQKKNKECKDDNKSKQQLTIKKNNTLNKLLTRLA